MRTGQVRHGAAGRGGKRLRWWLSTIGVGILVLSLGLSATSSALAAQADLIQPGSVPATDGTTVVWVNHGIYAVRMWVSLPMLVTSTPNAAYSFPDVSGDIVVWQQDCSTNGCPGTTTAIQAKNLVTGQQYDVANGYAPRISGTRVLYESGANLMLRDLATTAAPVVVTTVPAGWTLQSARIDGDRVAWAETQGATTWRIMRARIGETPTQVAEGTTMGFGGIGLAGSELVYVEGPTGIAAVDLTTGSVTHIAANPYDQEVTTNGRYVFWSRTSLGPGTNPNGQRRDIMGYDLQTSSSFVAVQDAGWNGLPATHGKLIAWVNGQSPNGAVHANNIIAVLPSGPQSDPHTTSPDWTYFLKYGHYLSFGFKDFWERSGDVPVFGFPITEEFSEPNPDQGTMLTVQYLERQRFEYHPENKGTPYEVELGRLGAEDAASRNLTSTAPFQALPSTTGSDANCTVFKETGHRVCFGFLDYWKSHGLDLGDSGISYRESLALFGYPISEEFVDLQTGLVTQYFERAVFEYHPANTAPYKVELRRLGADLLVLRGWSY
ncbi:MAG TPA: hypothetical protein VMU89_21205 [Thermomicrobiaceae bacterium]|nr:hypothetical protein [Thermomicrobiaceae bacterium]